MTAVTNTCTHNTHTHTHTHTRTHTYTHKYIHTHTPWPDLVCSLSRNLSISLSLGVPACVSGGGDALLAVADENSWQSRPGTRVPAVHSTHPAAACMLPVRFNSKPQSWCCWTRAQEMSAVIWSLQRAVAMRARILTWATPNCHKYGLSVSDTLLTGSSAYAHGRHC